MLFYKNSSIECVLQVSFLKQIALMDYYNEIINRIVPNTYYPIMVDISLEGIVRTPEVPKLVGMDSEKFFFDNDLTTPLQGLLEDHEEFAKQVYDYLMMFESSQVEHVGYDEEDDF